MQLIRWTLFILFNWLICRYHNTREVATHEIRNTVTHDGDSGRQGSGDNAQEKEPFHLPHVPGLPAGGPIGLRGSLPFRDGEGGHLYVYEQRNQCEGFL